MSWLLGSEAPQLVVVNIILAVIGMLLITKGGDLFTDSALSIARRTKIPPAIIGATVVSMATTFPEFVVSLTGALRGSPDIAVGNALGSCVCNLGLIVGVCALLKGILARRRGTDATIPVSRSSLFVPGGFMLGAALLLWCFGAFSEPLGTAPHGLVLWQGATLTLTALCYLGYELWSTKHSHFADDELDSDSPLTETTLRSNMLVFLLGAAVVLLGSRMLVANAAQVAREFGVSELVIGLSILAVGTSLPEFTVSIMSVIKGHGELGVGNIVGANILNICWVVGSCAMFSTLPIQQQTIMLDAPVAILLMLLLPIFAWRHQRISAPAGGALVCIYATYMIFISIMM